MRELVLQRIKDFKASENQLSGKEWEHCFFTSTGKDCVTAHVSRIGVSFLNDADLLRFLLYLTKQQDSAIEHRLRNQYSH